MMDPTISSLMTGPLHVDAVMNLVEFTTSKIRIQNGIGELRRRGWPGHALGIGRVRVGGPAPPADL